MLRLSVILLALVTSGVVTAETMIINATGHYVPLNEPEWMDVGDKREAYPAYQRHLAAIGVDKRRHSHWCSGTNVVNESEFEFGAGYCTVYDEDGDAYWTWFEVDGNGAFKWTVMGGIGKFKGASGSGVSKATTIMPDGTAEFHIEGRIELVDAPVQE